LVDDELPASLENLKVAVILIGTNDLGRILRKNPRVDLGTRAVDVAQDILELCKVFRARLDRAKVVVMGLMPRADRKLEKNEKPTDVFYEQPSRFTYPIRVVNDTLKAKSSEYDWLDYLDCEGWKDMMSQDRKMINPDVLPDGLHPSALGYEIWADHLIKHINPIMAQELSS